MPRELDCVAKTELSVQRCIYCKRFETLEEMTESKRSGVWWSHPRGEIQQSEFTDVERKTVEALARVVYPEAENLRLSIVMSICPGCETWEMDKVKEKITGLERRVEILEERKKNE